MAEEFKPMGMSMANLTIGYGAMMIIWGIAVSVLVRFKFIHFLHTIINGRVYGNPRDSN